MAIKSEVFGRCVEEIDVSVEVKNEDGWLCCEWNYMSCFGGDSGSRLAVEVGDGARYRMLFLVVWE